MRNSTSYVGTFYTKSAGDMLEVETIRKAVKAINANVRQKYTWSKKYAELTDTAEPGSPTQFRVCLRHADRLDVYVYER